MSLKRRVNTGVRWVWSRAGIEGQAELGLYLTVDEGLSRKVTCQEAYPRKVILPTIYKLIWAEKSRDRPATERQVSGNVSSKASIVMCLPLAIIPSGFC